MLIEQYNLMALLPKEIVHVGGGYLLKLSERGLKNLRELELDVLKSVRSEESCAPPSQLQGSRCNLHLPQDRHL